MNKIWFQICGSHSKDQPEWTLFHDKRFFVGGRHSMEDPALEAMKDEYKAGKTVHFTSLKHVDIGLTECPKSGYPQYAWYYHCKIASRDIVNYAQGILKKDANAYLIYYVGYPLLNTLLAAKEMKATMKGKVHVIYYKTKFWNDEVAIPNGCERTFKEKKETNDEFSEYKTTDTALVEIADTVYLADSLNTKGDPALDSPVLCSMLKAFRDSYLAHNPRVVLKSMRGAVYEVYNSIKEE